jgi:hypothetical protein
VKPLGYPGTADLWRGLTEVLLLSFVMQTLLLLYLSRSNQLYQPNIAMAILLSDMIRSGGRGPPFCGFWQRAYGPARSAAFNGDA